MDCEGSCVDEFKNKAPIRALYIIRNQMKETLGQDGWNWIRMEEWTNLIIILLKVHFPSPAFCMELAIDSRNLLSDR